MNIFNVNNIKLNIEFILIDLQMFTNIQINKFH